MDVFSKLRSRLDKLATTPRKASSSNLLHKFQICWDAIQYEFATEASDPRTVDETDIPSSLQQLLDILLKEQRLVEEGSLSTNRCAETFLNSDLLGQLVAMSANDSPLGFRGEVISTLSALLGLLEGQSLYHKSVHGAIRVLIAEALADKNLKYENEMLELASNIATKIKELPALLSLFLAPNAPRPESVPEESPPESVTTLSPFTVGGLVGADASSSVKTYNFPLFDYLTRYLNSEGRSGDVARASCCMLLDGGDAEMVEYLTQSDFVITITAGLGGLFSQLPAELPADAAANDGRRRNGRQGYAAVTFTRDVESLQSLVDFAQRVVSRWPEDKHLAEGILQGFRKVFLDQAVKPLLMTASDFDGTFVALLFYIRKMMAAVAPGCEIADVIVKFLLDGDDGDDGNPAIDITLQVRDVLVSKLNSLSEAVVTDTMRLFHLVLLSNPALALPLLIDGLDNVSADGPGIRPLDPHEQSTVVREWFALVSGARADDRAFETSLDAYMSDAEVVIASYPRAPPASLARLDGDLFLHKLLDKLATFFSQSPAINLALTGVLAQLAASPQLAPFLFAADHAFPEGKSPSRPSLHTVFAGLHAEAELRRAAMGDEAFDARCAKAVADDMDEEQARRGRAAHGAGVGDPWAVTDVDGSGAQDIIEGHWWKNMLVLDEFAKEMVALLLLAEGIGQQHLQFV